MALQQIKENKIVKAKTVVREKVKQGTGRVADLQPMRASSKDVVDSSRGQISFIDQLLSQNRRY